MMTRSAYSPPASRLRNKSGYCRARIRRLTGVVVALGLAASALAACGSSTKVSSSSTTATTTSSTTAPAKKVVLDTITPGVLKAATQTDEFPFAFVKNGKVTGFVVDLTNDIAKGLGLKVEYKTMAFAGLLSAISDHEYDIGAIAVLDTPARRKVVKFSEPIYYGSFGALALKNDSVSSLSGLANTTVGAVQATAEAAYVKKHYPKATLKEFPNETAAVGALEAHQVDAVLIGGPDTHTFLSEHSNLKLVGIVSLSTANALPMNKHETSLIRAVNKELNVLFDNGTYTSLYHHWFPGTPIPEQLLSQHPALKAKSS